MAIVSRSWVAFITTVGFNNATESDRFFATRVFAKTAVDFLKISAKSTAFFKGPRLSLRFCLLAASQAIAFQAIKNEPEIIACGKYSGKSTS